MKLIAEYNENNIECLVEANEDGTKNHFIEGVFMQSEQKNRNGRVYPKAIMEKAVDKYVKEQVKTKRAVGELNHPDGPTVNLDKVSHLIEVVLDDFYPQSVVAVILAILFQMKFTFTQIDRGLLIDHLR